MFSSWDKWPSLSSFMTVLAFYVQIKTNPPVNSRGSALKSHTSLAQVFTGTPSTSWCNYQRLSPVPLSLCGHGSMGETTVWLGVHTGSDERTECVCTGTPVGQAPVGVHQSEVITMGMVSGRRRKWSGTGRRNGNGRCQSWQWRYFGGGGNAGRWLGVDFRWGKRMNGVCLDLANR